MKTGHLSRKEKEALYIKKMTELQLRWGNPIDGDWDFIRDWTDQELEEGVNDTIGQLRFEKSWSAIRLVIAILAALGIIGLLRFIRQIF